jgi:integrase
MRNSKTVFEHSHREWRMFVSDNSGVKPILPVILTDNGVLVDFAHYILIHRWKSSSWQTASSFSIQLLLEYMEATDGLYETPHNMLRAFAEALFAGTVDNYCDPSGLWWMPRSRFEANKIIGHITQFTDWLAKRKQDQSLQLNPWQRATQHEQRLNCAAFEQRRTQALLGHLWRKQPFTSISRAIRIRSVPISNSAATKAFPETQFELFLSNGFCRRARDHRGRTNLRNILITMLMHFGGLRMSEALSLWVEDVQWKGGQVLVQIFHPEDGLAPDGKSNRASYLAKEYGLLPRNRLPKGKDKSFLGWKNPLVKAGEGYCFDVFFFPLAASFEFARLWLEYHRRQRVKPAKDARHPYAFTNAEGEPYSYAAFRDAHRRAVRRIGMRSAKMEGTTPHGHRHAYGQRLEDAGASREIIKEAMHHVSLESSEVYTEPSTQTVRRKLKELENIRDQKYRIDLLKTPV